MHQNGDYYLGYFKSNLKYDQYGKYVNNKGQNGYSYVGQFIEDISNGHCKIMFHNGNHYNGYVKDGLWNGKGIFEWKSKITKR